MRSSASPGLNRLQRNMDTIWTSNQRQSVFKINCLETTLWIFYTNIQCWIFRCTIRCECVCMCLLGSNVFVMCFGFVARELRQITGQQKVLCNLASPSFLLSLPACFVCLRICPCSYVRYAESRKYNLRCITNRANDRFMAEISRWPLNRSMPKENVQVFVAFAEQMWAEMFVAGIKCMPEYYIRNTHRNTNRQPQSRKDYQCKTSEDVRYLILVNRHAIFYDMRFTVCAWENWWIFHFGKLMRLMNNNRVTQYYECNIFDLPV